MATFRLELISPQEVLLDEDVLSAVLPGVEGDMTILPGHGRLVSVLNPGMIEAVDAGGEVLRAFVSRAVAEIFEDAVTILAEMAVMEEDLGLEHIDVEIQRLKSAMEEAPDETSSINASAQIWRLEQIRLSRLN